MFNSCYRKHNGREKQATRPVYDKITATTQEKKLYGFSGSEEKHGAEIGTNQLRAKKHQSSTEYSRLVFLLRASATAALPACLSFFPSSK